MRRIGIIDDNHKLLSREAADVLAGCDLIIHAGDVGSLEVIQNLEQIAPVRAVRGNVDQAPWADRLPHEALVEVQDKRIYVLHNLDDITVDPARAGYDVVVTGHSHKPSIRKVNGVLFVNPGSAGPRRFTLPIAVAMLHCTRHNIEARIHELALHGPGDQRGQP